MVCGGGTLWLGVGGGRTSIFHGLGKYLICDQKLTSRVVSSEISGRKFPEIYSNLSGNLLNNYFHIIIFNYNHTKNRL